SSRRGWTHLSVLGALGIGAGSLAGFLAGEARTPQPLVPLSPFRSRTFPGANLLTFWLYAALGGVLFFLPFNIIQVQGYKATAAGGAPRLFVLLSCSPPRASGWRVSRSGSRRPLIVGPAVAACGFALFARTGVSG